MKFLRRAKDGGAESTVTGYWLVEIKALFSMVLLRFANGSRDAYHSHAFDSANWILRGRVREFHTDGRVLEHGPSLWPVVTARSTFHRVVSEGTTWVLSVRGPWARTWFERVNGIVVELAHGRRVVA